MEFKPRFNTLREDERIKKIRRRNFFILLIDLIIIFGIFLYISNYAGTELEFVIMVIAVSCVKLLSAHNSTQHTSRKHKV
jgi:hypothetical protein